MKYRELKRYKYQTWEDLSFRTGICVPETLADKDKYVVLHTDGRLELKRGYCWDGPSGPTIDTKDSLRGSIVHDALYQLMRSGLLPLEHRKAADTVFRNLLLSSGMSRFRAGYFYWAVRRFSEKYARPQESRTVVLTAP